MRQNENNCLHKYAKVVAVQVRMRNLTATGRRIALAIKTILQPILSELALLCPGQRL